MRALNFVKIYEERLIQIDAKLEELSRNKKWGGYYELMAEKKSIESYLKDKEGLDESIS